MSNLKYLRLSELKINRVYLCVKSSHNFSYLMRIYIDPRDDSLVLVSSDGGWLESKEWRDAKFISRESALFIEDKSMLVRSTGGIQKWCPSTTLEYQVLGQLRADQGTDIYRVRINMIKGSDGYRKLSTLEDCIEAINNPIQCMPIMLDESVNLMISPSLLLSEVVSWRILSRYISEWEEVKVDAEE